MYSLSLQNILACICDINQCLERGRIEWNRRSSEFIHVRIDGCAITDPDHKKCDCLVFYSPINMHYTYIFLIEVKNGSYHISEVIEQLQNTRDAFNDMIQSLPSPLNVSTIAHALSQLYENNNRAMKLVSSSLLNIKQQRCSLVPVLYAERKVKLLKRVGYSERFKIKTGGKRRTKIAFMQCGKDILRILSPN